MKAAVAPPGLLTETTGKLLQLGVLGVLIGLSLLHWFVYYQGVDTNARIIGIKRLRQSDTSSKIISVKISFVDQGKPQEVEVGMLTFVLDPGPSRWLNIGDTISIRYLQGGPYGGMFAYYRTIDNRRP